MGKYAGSPQLILQKKFRSLSKQEDLNLFQQTNYQQTNYQQTNQNSTRGISHLVLKGSHKRDLSGDIFQGSKIDTCSYIAKRGNQVVALPYYEPIKQINQTDTLSNFTKLKSEARTQFTNTQFQHLGMERKPLTKYAPDSQRSRLPYPDFKQYYVNRSVLEIGNRTVQDKKQWITTNRNDFVQFNANQNLSQNHPGILAFKTQWNHQNSKR